MEIAAVSSTDISRASFASIAGILLLRRNYCDGEPLIAHHLCSWETDMLWTILLILLVLWVLGAFVVPVGGGLIHVLLVLAVIVLLFQFLSGRRVP